jgi:hypothetical protein
MLQVDSEIITEDKNIQRHSGYCQMPVNFPTIEEPELNYMRILVNLIIAKDQEPR